MWMHKKAARRLLAGLVLSTAIAVGALAVTETSTKTVSYAVGPGDVPSTSISTTVTSTITLATQYSDTLSQDREWVAVDANMTAVAMWHIEFDADSTSNVGQVRLITGDSDSLDIYVNKLTEIYQCPDSTSATRITGIKVRNPHATGTLTYHVVVTGK